MIIEGASLRVAEHVARWLADRGIVEDGGEASGQVQVWKKASSRCVQRQQAGHHADGARGIVT